MHNTNIGKSMAISLRNIELDQLLERVIKITGEKKTEAIIRALEERLLRLNTAPNGARTAAKLEEYLREAIWPSIPEKVLGRKTTKEEEEKILGYE